MKKNSAGIIFRLLILIGLILMGNTSCMLNTVDDPFTDWFGRTLYLALDFGLLYLLIFGIAAFFAGLFMKKGEAKKTWLITGPVLTLFTASVYLIAYWKELFSMDLYSRYLQLLISFKRPVYSVFIFLVPLLVFLSLRRLHKNLTESEDEQMYESPAKSDADGLKKTKTGSQTSENLEIQPRTDLFPDYFNTFERLHNVLGYTQQDQKITLENGLSFFQRGAREEVRNISSLFEGEQQLHSQEMYYVILAASSEAVAKQILQMIPCRFGQYQYVIVETPMGNWGRDINGIYKE